ncbi:hypothetical protein [Celeribacter baekdonensis]|uniref:Uncharacterized protein n=1 Tax=Celeribacter baekdonensis TaxID=875171 RepID=A0A2R4M2B9_9RHOB|nr:hypothetical protein [Celeribacter baekdonensis]AVW91249.1 hypothetical protein DA792_09290 [Celeribacter baekdonensis]
MKEQSKKTKMSLRGLWRFLTLALVDIFLAPFIAVIFIFGFNISDPFSNDIPPGDGVWHYYISLCALVFLAYLIVFYGIMSIITILLSRKLNVRRRALVRLGTFILWLGLFVRVELIEADFDVLVWVRTSIFVGAPLVWGGLCSSLLSEYVWERLSKRNKSRSA